MSEITRRYGGLDLSDRKPWPTATPRGDHSVPELAERIKALKASHQIEGSPQRAGRSNAATAEVPMTARIRRRVLSTEPEAEDVAAVPVESMPEADRTSRAAVEPPPAASSDSGMSDNPLERAVDAYREQVTHGRTRHRQMNLF